MIKNVNREPIYGGTKASLGDSGACSERDILYRLEQQVRGSRLKNAGVPHHFVGMAS